MFSLYGEVYADKKTGQLDQRMLAVSSRPNQSNVGLMITYDFNTTQSYMYNKTQKVNAGNWINLKVSQVNRLYEIKIDYTLVYVKTNFVPSVWTNVNLVTENTYGKEFVSMNVHYRNFKINTCRTRGKNELNKKNEYIVNRNPKRKSGKP